MAKKPFKAPTWASVIREAEKRGSFTPAEKEQSAAWTTCAVGERVSTRTATFKLALKAPEILEGPRHHPSSQTLIVRVRPHIIDGGALYDAGMDFMTAVEADDFEGARRALRRVGSNWRRKQAR